MNDPYFLSEGSHTAASGERCAMEWVAYIAGESHTDQPVCVDLPLRAFCTRFNDALGDVDRQKLRPYLARCIGTAGDGRTSERGYLCLDWLVRTYTPTWLELVGPTDDGARLRALVPIIDMATAKAAGLVVRAVHTKADAAWDAVEDVADDATRAAAGEAARDAAGAAARDAARAAAWGAAEDTAWVAARDAARAATRAAARAAAEAARVAAGAAAWGATRAATREAARDVLAPTVQVLQASAFDLLNRMLPTVMLELPADVQVRAAEVLAS